MLGSFVHGIGAIRQTGTTIMIRRRRGIAGRRRRRRHFGRGNEGGGGATLCGRCKRRMNQGQIAAGEKWKRNHCGLPSEYAAAFE